jgi:hypothetical protein
MDETCASGPTFNLLETKNQIITVLPPKFAARSKFKNFGYSIVLRFTLTSYQYRRGPGA